MKRVGNIVGVCCGRCGQVRSLGGGKDLLRRLVLSGEGRREVGRLEIRGHRRAPASAGEAVRNALLERKHKKHLSIEDTFPCFHLIGSARRPKFCQASYRLNDTFRSWLGWIEFLRFVITSRLPNFVGPRAVHKRDVVKIAR